MLPLFPFMAQTTPPVLDCHFNNGACGNMPANKALNQRVLVLVYVADKLESTQKCIRLLVGVF